MSAPSLAFTLASGRKRKSMVAFGRKVQNTNVIADTLQRCKEDAVLRKQGPTHILRLNKDIKRSDPDRKEGTLVNVEVRDCDCVVVAKELSQLRASKVWILNMASASRAGGGVMKGCNAQEEHLCRSSNLLPQLPQKYYPLHNPLERTHPTDIPDFKVLVTKEVCFFKVIDEAYAYHVLPRAEWFTAGVLTAAAEKIQGSRCLGPSMTRFVDFLMDAAEMQDCTHLVLSAWGCGAFGQCPDAVANCFRERLVRSERKDMTVVFAITDDHNSDDNFSAFRRVFGASACAASSRSTSTKLG